MKSKEQYDQLYKDSIKKIQTDNYQIDELIDVDNDNRFGVTLILRPDNNTKREIQNLLVKFRVIEPNQYFYPDSDLHLTVMSMRSCYKGFDLSQIKIEDYVTIIQKSIAGLNKFEIEFKGLTASPSCIMLQGFLKENTLNQIRNNLRENFNNSGLQYSIDTRYVIQMAHCTIIRLKEKLSDKETFLNMIEEYKEYNFGSFPVSYFEFG